MISLWVHNNDVFVYTVEEWSELRKNHRILGELLGQNNTVPALPLKLQPEEVALLIELKLAKLVSLELPKESSVARFESKLLEEESVIYKNKRKCQLETMREDIVAAKRKKGDTRTADEIITDELNKAPLISKKNMIWPILLQPLDFSSSEVKNYDNLKTNPLKSAVFKDLWQRGYYITPGHKFGGDFLAYLGDPIIYHSIFIIKCVDDISKPLNPSEIVAFGRLGSSVKKKAVFASMLNDEIKYLTINWIDA